MEAVAGNFKTKPKGVLRSMLDKTTEPVVTTKAALFAGKFLWGAAVALVAVLIYVASMAMSWQSAISRLDNFEKRLDKLEKLDDKVNDLTRSTDNVSNTVQGIKESQNDFKTVQTDMLKLMLDIKSKKDVATGAGIRGLE